MSKLKYLVSGTGWNSKLFEKEFEASGVEDAAQQWADFYMEFDKAEVAVQRVLPSGQYVEYCTVKVETVQSYKTTIVGSSES